jgi:hypothetical protein
MTTVAGAQTLTMLASLDADRKKRVLQFLYDSDLIKSPRIINLFKARLINADLVDAYLPEVDLSNTFLRRADLKGATARRRAVVRNQTAEDPVDDEERAIRADLELWETGSVMNTRSPRGNRPLVLIEQLQQSRSLKGATLPRGEKYEAWLKGKEGRGKNGENPGA